MIDEEVYAKLSGDSGIATICADRIYTMIAPQDAPTPYIVWQVVSMTPAPDALDQESDAGSARLQVDAYGATYGAALSLGRAVRAAMKNWRPTGGSVFSARLDSRRANREADPALRIFRVSQDFIIGFIEE